MLGGMLNVSLCYRSMLLLLLFVFLCENEIGCMAIIGCMMVMDVDVMVMEYSTQTYE